MLSQAIYIEDRDAARARRNQLELRAAEPEGKTKKEENITISQPAKVPPLFVDFCPSIFGFSPFCPYVIVFSFV